MMDTNVLRKEILRLDPDLKIGKRSLLPFIVAAIAVSLIYSGARLILAGEHSVIPELGASLAMGFGFSLLCFFNHELLHGSVLRSKKIARVLAYPGFFIFCISPELWRVWHNELHHRHTNQLDGLDPDLAGDWPRMKQKRHGTLMVDALPGSGHPLSFIFIFFLFSLQAANVLWLRSRERPELYRGMNRRRVVLETLAFYLAWIVLLASLPLSKSIFLLLIPLATANWIVFNYVGLPHGMRPLSNGADDTLGTTISLKSPRLINFLFLNFSLHVEHHLFPMASSTVLPRIQEVLLRHFKEEYVLVDHWKALRIYHSTPRAYADPTHLVYPRSKRAVDLIALRQAELV
jgi:fatty acid desaturase